MVVDSRRKGRARVRSAAFIESLEFRRLLNAAIVVNTTADETIVNSTTSLREAITLAETNAGDDTITFDPTVFTNGSQHTILLNSTLELTGANGKLDIDGAGSGILAISGNDANRVFTVDAPFVGSLNNMTIRHGRASGGGGGINNFGSLTLDTDVFDSDKALGTTGADGDATTPGGNGTDALGGAIDNHDELDVEGCTFDSNEVLGGGGGSSPDGAGNGGDAKGGAIYTSGPLTVATSFFENDEATGGVEGQTVGGDNLGVSGDAAGADIGIGVLIPIVTISTTTFTNSVALGGAGNDANGAFTAGQGGDAEGGSIYTDTSSFHLKLCMFSDVEATAGAGGGGGVSGTGGEGGKAEGGAFYNSGTAVLDTDTFTSCAASGGDGGSGTDSSPGGDASGGALFSDGTSLTITGSSFSANTAAGGSASGSGGTGSSRGGTATGGAVYIAGIGASSITLTNFINNAADGGNSVDNSGGNGVGGAIFTGQALTLDSCDIGSNESLGGNSGSKANGVGGANGFAGGLMLEAAATILNCSVHNNTAQGGNGGNGTAGDGGSAGAGLGGAIYQGGLLTLSNSTLASNQAAGGTAGSGTATGGAGGGAAGGGVLMDNTTLNATNDTIIDNGTSPTKAGSGTTAGLDGRSAGGGISVSDFANLFNVIVADNAAQTGPDISGSVTLVNCLVSTSATDYTLLLGSMNNLLATPANLGPLTDNGGPTLTALPEPGSAAIDAGNSADATAAGLTNDERGAGFPRIIGSAVDIGAVEVGAPLMTLLGNGKTIANGDTTATSLDFTDFGTAKLGTPIDRTFTIRNDGSATLNLGFITLPFGFSVKTPFAPTVVPGGTTTFTLRFNPPSAGAFGGDVEISNNSNNTLSHYDFTIGATANGSMFRINFQPAASEVPSGYMVDSGSIFADRGDGYSYGWDASATTFTRERNAVSDQARDTLIHMQLFGTRTWNVAVPNGTYSVHLVAGDPSFTDSVYKINVEGVLTVNGTPNSSNHFVEGTKTVTVTDGKLTISNATGSVNDKLDYVEITPVTVSTIKVNFQTPSSPTPAGYLADSGAVYGSRGNGQTYGWNQSATSFSRDRNSKNSPDQQHDTLIHTELYGNRTWEIAVPNGSYSVHLVAGDPDYTDSVDKYNLEGILALSGTPTSGNHWISGTVTVNVSDGKLTLTNASGSVNNKIDYIEITPM